MVRQTSFESIAALHPGEIVEEYLEFLEWSQRDLARRTGLTTKTISEICNGKAPITPATALAFEKVLQRPAHFWLNLQRQFDEIQARDRAQERAAGWSDWVRQFPLREMRKLGFSLPPGRSDADVLLGFFGVTSPEIWASVWQASAVQFRQTRTSKARDEAIAAWVREAEIGARGLNLAEFDAAEVCGATGMIRQLTKLPVGEVLAELQETCASVGIAVVMVPELRGTAISGCARWLTGKRALIGLTTRYKTDAQFWFTFFHELGHLLLHRGAFVVDNVEDVLHGVVDPEMRQLEVEANQLSADTLIPPALLGRFIRAGVFTDTAICQFSETVGIGRDIVVERLRLEGVLVTQKGNRPKRKLG